MVFLGAVQSVAPPTLTVNYKADTFTISGNGWTPNSPVTIFYDVKDTAHRIAAATADYFGAFTVNVPRVLGTTEGAHSLIVVQGALQATVTYNASPVSPPDDRLLNPILSISSDIQAIKNKLDTINGEIQAVEAKLDVGGSFYNFVNGWFGNINNRISNVENKIDAIKQKVDSMDGLVCVYANSVAFSTTMDVENIIIHFETDEMCTFYLTFWTSFEDKDDYIAAFASGGTWQDPIAHSEGTITSWLDPTETVQTISFTGEYFHLQHKNEDGESKITFHLMVVGPPNTVVSDFYSDYPQIPPEGWYP
jgi:hypothetical protein